MLEVYCEQIPEIPKNCIDLSKHMSSELVDKLETIYAHHSDATIYLGFLDPLFMLSPQEETRMRKAIRKFRVLIAVRNPFTLPFSWKNGISKLFLLDDKNAENTQALNDGSSA